MASAEVYEDSVNGVRSATEKTAELWRDGARRLADQAGVMMKLPTVDVTQLVQRYFDYLQRAVDLNRDYVLASVSRITDLSDAVRRPVTSLAPLLQAHVQAVAEFAADGAEVVERVLGEQAEAVEQAQQERARRPYEGLSRAELSSIAERRNLPKSGTVEELIDRLIEADQR